VVVDLAEVVVVEPQVEAVLEVGVQLLLNTTHNREDKWQY
jgi:hypothetical protein